MNSIDQSSPAMPVVARKRYLFLMFKVGVTAVLLYWLLFNVSLDEMRGVLAPIQVHHIIAGLALQLIVIMLGCLRWWVLLHHVSRPIPLTSVLPSFYLGIFFNNLMPTTVGGDAIRVLHMRGNTLNTKALISSTIMDRMIGLIGVIIIGTTTLIAFPVVSDSLGLKTVMLLGLIFSLGIFPLLASAPFTGLVNKLTIRFQHAKKRRWLLELTSLCQSYAGAKMRLLAALALTLVLQTLTVLTYYMLGIAIGIQLPLTAYFASIPVIVIAASLPISLGGLGIREGTLVALFVAAGVEPHMAIGLSTLYLLVLWGASLPGALVLLLPSRKINKTIEA